MDVMSRRNLYRTLFTMGAVLLSPSTVWPGEAKAEVKPGTGVDVILITIDTLRADALGFAGNGAVATPLLNQLAATGRVFPHAHAHNVVTLPSHTNILTGLYPYQHGVRDNQGFRLNPRIPTLATVLADAGYSTAAFVAAYPLDSTFGLDRGFSLYDDGYPKGAGASDFSMPERRGDQVVSPALSWWQEHTKERRFLWVHLFDPHAPYDPPEPFASRYRDRPYLGEVAAVDYFLTPLLQPFLDGEERPALVVLTADHGEALGDHGELTHGLFAYEATLRVPLVLWGPGVKPGRDLRAARHVDILPTVLEVTGISRPTGYSMPGCSLLGEEDSISETYFEALSAHLNRGWAPLHGLLQGTKKFISLPIPELYDLEADPFEMENRVREERRLAGELRDALPTEALKVPPRATEDPAVAARLRSLGYLSGGAAPRAHFGPADDPKNLVELDHKMHRVIELYSAGALNAAVRLVQEVVDARPGMALSRSLLAQALLESGRQGEALEAMRDAFAHGATTAALRRQFGLTLAEAGLHDEALRVLEPLAAQNDVEALAAYGLALSEAGQQDLAEIALHRLLQLDPEHAVAHQQIALVELRRGRWSAARGAALRALALDGGMARAWNTLGVALFELGEVIAALEAWQQAVDLNSSLFDALYNLGTKALESGREVQAREALERFVKTAPPTLYSADLRRARVLLARLQRQKAAQP
jgi:arylsulfatase A-like enzyme/Tfp pilus assembly protein PilF